LEIHGRVSSSKTQGKQEQDTASSRSELLAELHLESNPEALCLVRATVRGATEILEFPESETRAIVRSVDEALTNVIRHAYEGRKGMPIHLSFSRLWKGTNPGVPHGIEIVLADTGRAVDLARLKGRALEDVRPGGLGLHFIKQSMDVVEFSRKNDKNFLRLVKYRAPSKAAPTVQGE
jgi:serine/threonine-protein kinase RsbW